MEQYISKADIVAEIERRKKYYENIQTIKPVYESNIEDFNELLSFIDTLEVKEVDLYKEIKKYIEDNICGYCVPGVEETARYFFELGVKTQTKNIWHNASEELPVINRRVLLYTEKGTVTQGMHDGGSWTLDMWVPKFPKILKWCYLSDIIPTN